MKMISQSNMHDQNICNLGFRKLIIIFIQN
jgi:hypothetical protein